MGRSKKVFAVSFFFLLLSWGAAAYAVDCPPGAISTVFGCVSKDTNSLNIFLQKAYQVALLLAAILAVIRFILAGLRYTTSGGNPDAIKTAKDEIWGVILGIVLLVLGAVFFNTLGLEQPTQIIQKSPDVPIQTQ